MKKAIRVIDTVLAIILVFVYGVVIYGNAILPSSVVSYSSSKIIYDEIFYLNDSQDKIVDYQNDSNASSQTQQIKIFGIIPVKKTEVSNVKEKTVFVSGESFGIKLYADGIIVVGTKDVETDDGKCNPAKEAGIEKGDIIIKINNKKMTSSTDVEEILNDNNGKPYEIVVKRNGNYKTFTVNPVYSSKEGCYKVGLWVRDSTAGIGTITFYNPENNVVAALGHPITDVDTNEIIPILDGEAVKATVTKLYKSTAGETGSLCCEFSTDVIGNLTDNKSCGIFGIYTCDIENEKAYEVASAQEVEKGKAQLLCTLDDEGAKFYDIEITRISYRESNEDKNMVVKITDSALLEKTGGIVQGMSGSPIIQNGKLVGALTHVVVDNPEKGYAIFAQKMVEESENTK